MSLLKDIKFANNNIYSNNGTATEEYTPLFNYIEKYCLDQGASTKWVENTLIVYSKGYLKLDFKKCDLSEYYVQFIFAEYTEDSTEYDEEYSYVRFGDEVSDINSIQDLNNSLDEIINKETPPKLYRDIKEEIIEKDSSSQEDFQKGLKNLRISEDEFLDLLEIYENKG